MRNTLRSRARFIDTRLGWIVDDRDELGINCTGLDQEKRARIFRQNSFMKPVFQAGDTLAECLKNSTLPALEARILIAHITQLTRVQLITQSESHLNTDQADTLNTMIAKRLAGEPIAYLIGEREFYGLKFTVTPAVLIPRPETELLVELALTKTPAHAQVLDLGTGSGAIAIAFASQRQDCQVTALDMSAAALTIARLNADQLGIDTARLSFIESDWYQNIAEKKYHSILSNPPYIEKNDAHLQQGDLRFEPLQALTDFADGLSAYRQIISGAGSHLHEGGWLLMEHGYDQAEAVQALLKTAGFKEIQSWPDLAGILRVTGGILREEK